MSALFVLIGISLLVAIGFLIAFIWSVKKGQYEDECTPAMRMLLDDDITITEDSNSKKQL